MIDKASAEPDVDEARGDLGRDRQEGHGGRVHPARRVGEVLTLRGKNAANVFVHEAFGQYDYLTMSVTG